MNNLLNNLSHLNILKVEFFLVLFSSKLVVLFVLNFIIILKYAHLMLIIQIFGYQAIHLQFKQNTRILWIYLLRGLSSKCTPSFMSNMCPLFVISTGICVLSFGSSVKFNNKLYKIAYISIKVKREPMQFLGPMPNGRRVSGQIFCLFSSLKRSGSNFFGCGMCSDSKLQRFFNKTNRLKTNTGSFLFSIKFKFKQSVGKVSNINNFPLNNFVI